MTDNDIQYYRRRAEQARGLAERAADSPARRAHLEMASRYDRLAAGEPLAGAGSHIVERG